MERGSPHLGQDEIRIPYFEFEKSGIRKKKQVTYYAIHPNKTKIENNWQTSLTIPELWRFSNWNYV